MDGATLKAVKIVDQQELAALITVIAGGHIRRDELARRIVRCVSDLPQNDTPEAGGLCFSGLLLPDGVMRGGSTNLSNIDQVPLKEYFHELLRLRCPMENDAISAMRGEATPRTARSCRHVTMTFGSG
jgi:predicted NBD/HSP70 family sugar kinase